MVGKSNLQETILRGRIYGADPKKWICACPYFQERSKKVCKHLLVLMPVEKPLGYPQPPRYNPAAFQKFPPFIRFDLPFARDKNTDMVLVGNGDLSDISERD